jgi:hypothetical protein
MKSGPDTCVIGAALDGPFVGGWFMVPSPCSLSLVFLPSEGLALKAFERVVHVLIVAIC